MASSPGNPIRDASCFKSAFLHYGLSFVSPLVKKGASITEADFWDNTSWERSSNLGERIKNSWKLEKETHGSNASLFKAYYSVFGRRYIAHSAVLFIKSIAFFAMTQFLHLLLEGLQSALDARSLYLYALGFVVCAGITAMIHHSYFWLAWRAGHQWRVSALALIMDKSLRLRLDALGALSVGGLVSIASNDLERTTKLCQMLAYVVVGPVEASVALWLLWRVVGVSALAGYAVMGLLVLWQGQAGKLFARLRYKSANLADSRLHLTAQVVGGARVLKAFGWEAPFFNEVKAVRAKELKSVRATNSLRAISEGIFNVAPVVMGAATFLCAHFGEGRVLRSSDVFVALTLLQFMQAEMCMFFPRAIESIAETGVLFQRLQRLLELPETAPVLLPSQAAPLPLPDALVLKARNVSAHWPSSGSIQLGALSESEKKKKKTRTTSSHSPSSPLPSPPRLALKGLDVDVRRGEICGVVGPVGCGKSTLLLRVLNEAGTGEDISLAAGVGVCDVRGVISYCPQTPWIETGSIRDNILLAGRRGGGLKGGDGGDAPHSVAVVDEERYAKVLHACCLDTDCLEWEQGDRTLVGERGVTLSGGQKARVGLARALYAGGDLYLLDDPLAAVDPRVGKLLFQRAIQGFAAASGAGVLLVTHQTRYLKEASTILVLGRDGGLEMSGTWSELTARFATGLNGSSISGSGSGESFEWLQKEEGEGEKVEFGAPEKGSQEDNAGTATSDVLTPIMTESKEKGLAAPPPHSTLSKETMVEGVVSWAVYIKYAAACASPPTLFLLSILMTSGTVLSIMCNVSLAAWTSLSPSSEANSPADVRAGWLYGGLVLATLSLSIFRPLTWFSLANTGSGNLHDAAFSRVISAPTAFFDVNPTGRILNRFSKDLAVLDDIIPWVFFDFANVSLACLGTLALLAAVNPYLLLVIAPLSLAFYQLRERFLAVSRVIKRVEATSRSPIYSILTECAGGLTTIRAFNLHATMERRFGVTLDRNGRAYWAWLATTRWLGIRLDAFCIALLVVTVFMGVALRGELTAAYTGLLLSQIVALTNAFQWAVRQSSEVETSMIGCERVLEYAELSPVEDLELDLKAKVPEPSLVPLGSEATSESQGGVIISVGPGEELSDKNGPLSGGKPSAWPSRGQISFNRLSMRYRPELPLVLDEVTMHLEGGQRLGVVGRTGAGKTSLLAAILRLTEPRRTETTSTTRAAIPTSGVVIDGVDTASIHLTTLRRAVGLIPQDPHLTEGSIRSNLDPFKAYSDEECLAALEAVQLGGVVREKGGLTEGLVEEGGSNFSLGQKQLLCLARAALRRTKILLMDEATANVDHETCHMVSTALRSAFPSSSIIAIAHRLETIIDFDRVLVMHAGRVAEFGAPWTLLETGESLGEAGSCTDGPGAFWLLCRETGQANYSLLKESAAAKWRGI